MKILLFSDIHFKLYSNIFCLNSGFLELVRAKKSIEFVIQQVEEQKPDLVVCLGDIYHNQEYNYNIVVSVVNNCFYNLYQVCKENDVKLFLLVGNHDLVGFNELFNKDISMIDGLFCDKVVNSLFVYENLSFIPYMKDEQLMFDLFREQLDSVDYVFGHCDVKGFKFNKYKVSDKGLNSSYFNKQVQYFLGHYHIRQQNNNVNFIGSLYQQSFEESGEKGITILDTETNQIKFIENTNVGYLYTISYDDLLNNNFNNMPTKIDAVRILVDEDIYKTENEQIIRQNITKYFNNYEIKRIKKDKNNKIEVYKEQTSFNEEVFLKSIFNNDLKNFKDIAKKYFNFS